MTTSNRDNVYRCIEQVASLKPASAERSGAELWGGDLLDLFWSLSEIRPDLDALPMIISEHQEPLKLSCRQRKSQQAGQEVCAMMEKIARLMPSGTREILHSSCGALDKAFKSNSLKAVSEALCDVVKVLVDEQHTGGTLPVFVEGDSIRIGRHFKVKFCRTLRVPDDGKDYPLPAGLGCFPLHAVADYANRVPSDWLETGGFFLPMYQSEAMYLEFSGQSWRPNIAKVGVGRINAVTGKAWNENISAVEQDYLLCPHQRWLDGINAGQGFVRQFVAMPLGQGYTIEEQVTDECRYGGIQIAAFSAKPGIFPEIDPSVIKMAKLKSIDSNLMAGILKLSSPYQSVLAMHVLGYSEGKILDTLEVSIDVIEEYERKAEERVRGYTKGVGKRFLLKKIQKEALEQLESVIGNTDAYSRLKEVLFPSPREDIRYSIISNRMGLGAGGRITQKIIADTFGAETWDKSNNGSIFIHLVNSEVYKEITGNQPPNPPVEAVLYQQKGIPWFKYYDDNHVALSPSRILSRVKSIFTIDQQRGKVTIPEPSIPIDCEKIREIKIPSREERFSSLVDATFAAEKNGSLKSVIRLATAILDISAESVPAMEMRANAYLRLGFYDEARSDTEQILKLSKDNVDARCMRAEIALATGFPEMALLEAKAAKRLSANNPTLDAIIEKANAALTSK